MGDVVDAVFGGGDDGAADAARAQADAIRKSAEAQAEQARFTAQAAQIQREGLNARMQAEEKAKSLAPPPTAAPEVTVGTTTPVDQAEAARKRNPRKAFQRKPTTNSSLTI